MPRAMSWHLGRKWRGARGWGDKLWKIKKHGGQETTRQAISFIFWQLFLLTSNIPKNIMVFNNRLSHVPYHQDYLISNIVPSPYTLVMWVIGLDEGMISDAEIFKVPFIFGSCFLYTQVVCRINKVAKRKRWIDGKKGIEWMGVWVSDRRTRDRSWMIHYISPPENSTMGRNNKAINNSRNPVSASICWNIMRLSPDGNPTINVLCKSKVGDRL